jgi:hypothetical protein
MYGPPVFDNGFYYDDWALAAAMQDAGGDFVTDYYDACHQDDTGGRPGACAYHAGVYFLFGFHIKAYHLLALATTWLIALLTYILLIRCRLPTVAAAATAGFVVLFPGSDTGRLWPTGNNLQWATLLFLAGLLILMRAAEREDGRRWAFAAVGLALFVAAGLTYDGVIAAVGLAGIPLWFALRNRAALIAGAASAALAGGFVLYRFVSVSEKRASDFNVDRTPSQLVDRAGALLEGAWRTFDVLFLRPAWIYAGVVAIAILAAAIRPAARRPLAGWLAAAVSGAVFVAACVSIYLTAHDLYLPQPNGLFNRLNVSATSAYCLVFVALLGALYTAVRHLVPQRASRVAAIASVAVLVAPVLPHQYDWSRTTEASYTEAWKQETRALHAIGAVIDRVPERNAQIVSFGHPIWEERYIPVFAANWDLRGAIDSQTDHDPLEAIPFADLACGEEGLTRAGATFLRYDEPSPMYFIDVNSRRVERVSSRGSCDRWVAEFGIPPMWGRTITGGA